MKKLKVNLENCFGIQGMKDCIDFSKNNVVVIYAPNGTMKSSLAKTLEAISTDKPIEERIFGRISTYSITDENDVNLNKESIMVINPFEKKLCDNQGLLMANPTLRDEYLRIHKGIDDKKHLLYARLKAALGYSPRSSFNVESVLLTDWDWKKNELFQCLKTIANMLHAPNMNCNLAVSEIDYNTLFNEKVYTFFSSEKTANYVKQYEEKYNELVDKSLYMQKGIIDHNNYSNISEVLNNNGFFGAKNEVKLNAKDGSSSKMITSQAELNELIKREKETILNTKELQELFEKINKMISKNKDTQTLNSFLQKHPEIVLEYNDIETFKRKIWIKVILTVETTFLELIDDYEKAQNNLNVLRNKAKCETTDWNVALSLFKKRFFVPFEIETSNQEDVILNLDMPSFKYVFSDESGDKEVSKDDLLEVLSTGEERAYYILNLIFQILVAKKDGKEKLIVLDDISESFDYKNKHAIIEYISDISRYQDAQGEKLFKVLLLTHNFDFYRTVASRITTKTNAYIAFSNNGEIHLMKGHYTRTLFVNYKERLNGGNCDNIVIASIPFVRNLIEYTVGDIDVDYLKLTSILHYKTDTCSITIQDVEDIFNTHWCKSKTVDFANGREHESIYNIIFSEAEKIGCQEKIEIENKVILSIAIRLKAEEFMIRQISSKVSGGDLILDEIYSGGSQTGNLIAKYKEHINDEAVEVLEQVSLLTTENIHLNSFMFEPILDMSLVHLYELYQVVKVL